MRKYFTCLQAYERRFPTCPQIPVFVGCEITLDEESEDGATRTTERRCKLNVDAPYILKKVCPYMDDLIFIMTCILSSSHCKNLLFLLSLLTDTVLNLK